MKKYNFWLNLVLLFLFFPNILICQSKENCGFSYHQLTKEIKFNVKLLNSEKNNGFTESVIQINFKKHPVKYSISIEKCKNCESSSIYNNKADTFDVNRLYLKDLERDFSLNTKLNIHRIKCENDTINFYVYQYGFFEIEENCEIVKVLNSISRSKFIIYKRKKKFKIKRLY